MRVDGQDDGQADRREDEADVRNLGTLEDEHGEDDRREAARAEPANERDRWGARTGPEERERDRDHPDDSERQHGEEERAPAHPVKHHRDDRCAEDEERCRAESVANRLDHLGRLLFLD